ncbi:MAG: hemolysin III family protein, partial [Clostridia bacterium]|nr:hemolysin III family protein [Clostridia bacterium]
MKRTKLKDRILPPYTRGEEIFNMVSHISGGGLGIIMGALCIIKAFLNHDPYQIVSAFIYGVSMVVLYTMSSIYHGLVPVTVQDTASFIDFGNSVLSSNDATETFTQTLLLMMAASYTTWRPY